MQGAVTLLLWFRYATFTSSTLFLNDEAHQYDRYVFAAVSCGNQSSPVSAALNRIRIVSVVYINDLSLIGLLIKRKLTYSYFV